MIHNTIHTWLAYKFEHFGKAPLTIIFHNYLNSLALACEAKLNNSPNEQQD